METLLICDRCRHGAIAHDAAGCELIECRCTASRQEIVDMGIAAAREEIRLMWERPSLPPGAA
jgi:hypothetical protein